MHGSMQYMMHGNNALIKHGSMGHMMHGNQA